MFKNSKRVRLEFSTLVIVKGPNSKFSQQVHCIKYLVTKFERNVQTTTQDTSIFMIFGQKCSLALIWHLYYFLWVKIMKVDDYASFDGAHLLA